MASSSGSDSDSSFSSSQEDFEEFLEDFEQFGIQPYQFEPQVSDNSSIADDGDDQAAEEEPGEEELEDLGRLRDTDWYVLEL